MEKFFDIVCRFGGLTPSAAVLVTTVRAIKHHGGDRGRPARRPRARRAPRSRAAWPTCAATSGSSSSSACPAWSRSTAARATPTRRSSSSSAWRSRPARSRAEVNEGFAKGGVGAADLAEAVVDACERAERVPPALRGRLDRSRTRSRRSPRGLRRRRRLLLSRGREEDRPVHGRRPRPLPDLHGQDAPVAVGRPELLNAPENFTLPVRDIRAYTGAGWLVPLCGDITQMPGLGKTPGGAERRHRRGRAHRRAVLSAAAVTAYHLLGHG